MVTRTKDQNSYTHGSWNAICDVCGFKFKALDLKKRWDGLYVCKEDYEVRHPSDFQKGVKDDPSVPYVRPDSNADSSYTDIGGNAVTTDNTVDTQGDASVTVTWGTDNAIQIFNTELTGARIVFLADGTAVAGDRFHIYKTATSSIASNTLKVFDFGKGNIRTMPAEVKAAGVYEYSGSIWFEVSYTTIGL